MNPLEGAAAEGAPSEISHKVKLVEGSTLNGETYFCSFDPPLTDVEWREAITQRPGLLDWVNDKFKGGLGFAAAAGVTTAAGTDSESASQGSGSGLRLSIPKSLGPEKIRELFQKLMEFGLINEIPEGIENP